MKKNRGLTFVGILLGIIGVAIVGVGLYFKFVLNAGGYGTISSAMILEFGREFGMHENLSTWDQVKLWCAENTLLLIVGGTIVIILGIVICKAASKLYQKAIMQQSTQVAYWSCSACGTENKWNLGYCSNCHQQKPAHVQYVTYNAAEPAKPADSVLKLWFQTKRSWFIVVLLSICSIISIVSPLIAINAGGEIVWSQYMGSFFISILTNLCICGTLAYDHCSKRNIAFIFSVSWLVLSCLVRVVNFMSLYEIGAINYALIISLFLPILGPLLLLLLVSLKNKMAKMTVSIIAIIFLTANAALSTLGWLQTFERLVGIDWYRLQITINEISSLIYNLAMIIVFWPISGKCESNVVDQGDQA
ncbi:MAG: hypothetical protein IJX67_07205 [Oscillospiraceae bacterium]|nr:hypothetical protein [Clostridia bacterium]MBQ9168177.1 hypothetical protein [Oscillospiraceae bacterium]